MILLLAYEVRGFVYGEGGKPLPSAVVLLRRLPDTSKAGGTYTDENGFFKIGCKTGKVFAHNKVRGAPRSKGRI
jgi:hypothetical protein